MTIAKGAPWGAPGRLPADGVVAHSDAEVRAAIEAARRARRPLPVVGLLGGDLCRTLGGRGDADRLRSAEAVTYPVDVVAVTLDGRPYWFAAHLVARSRGRGRWYVAMNAQWIGPYNVAPRAHPDDALVDILEGELPLGERRKVQARARRGAHLPHPAIRERRTAAATAMIGRRLRICLDGEPIPTGNELTLAVEPDALTVVV